jgi:hypothetical protein
MIASRFFRAIVTVGCVAALAGCASKPPLPKRASIDHLPQPAADTDFNAVVAGADIIYFPAERAASGARSEPSALILDALRQSGAPFAIAWDLIDAGEQPLLDELPGKAERERDQLIARLDLVGTGRTREYCRAVLRDERLAGVRHLAVRAPAPLVATIRAGTLPPDEERRISGGFIPPDGGLELYAERIAGTRGASQGDLAGAYRAQVIGQQFAAGQIIDHFRGAGAGGKLLVFLRREDLVAGQGVPHYVVQKTDLRQVILASDVAQEERRKLLTGTAAL